MRHGERGQLRRQKVSNDDAAFDNGRYFAMRCCEVSDVHFVVVVINGDVAVDWKYNGVVYGFAVEVDDGDAMSATGD